MAPTEVGERSERERQATTGHEPFEQARERGDGSQRADPCWTAGSKREAQSEGSRADGCKRGDRGCGRWTSNQSGKCSWVNNKVGWMAGSRLKTTWSWTSTSISSSHAAANRCALPPPFPVSIYMHIIYTCLLHGTRRVHRSRYPPRRQAGAPLPSSLSHTHALSLSHTRSFSLTHTLFHTHTATHTHSLSHTHTHALSLCLSLTHTHSL